MWTKFLTNDQEFQPINWSNKDKEKQGSVCFALPNIAVLVGEDA